MEPVKYENESEKNSNNNTSSDGTNKKYSLLIALVLLIVGLTAGVYLWQQQNQDPVAPELTGSPVIEQFEPAYVGITNTGFVPQTIKISRGQKVIWTNKDVQPRALAADPHPEHSTLPSLVSEGIDQDGSYEFTFTEEGSFDYHDESDPTITGTVIVE